MKYLTMLILAGMILAVPSFGCGGTAPATSTARAATVGPGQTLFSEGVTGGKPILMAHPLQGFETCSACHYIGTTGAVHLINDAHACDECHVRSPMPAWSHGMPVDTACVICHLEPGSG